MKFLLDESVEHRLAGFLQQLGHDVKAIVYDYPASLPDHNVLAIANQEKRILLTNDRGDFGELIFRRGLPHHGVILFRLKDADIETKSQRLKQVISEYTDQLHHFIVVTPGKIRVKEGTQNEKEAA